jgi:hypothetical protein
MWELNCRKGTVSVFLRCDAEPEIQELSSGGEGIVHRNPLDRMGYFLA